MIWQIVFWVPMCIALSVAVSSAVSLFATRIDAQTVLFSMLCATLPVVAFATRRTSFPDLGSPGAWGWLAFCAFALVSVRMFAWGVVEAAGALEVLLPNNLGDASLHLALVNFLSSSPGFWPMSPWFAPSPLEYPLGTDFFDAMMVVLFERSPLESMALTSMILSVSIAALLWGWSRAFGIALLLLCAPLSDLLFLVEKSAEESSWKSLLLTVVAPQRGMLVALPLGLSFLVMARRLCSGPRPESSSWSSCALLFLPLSPLLLFSVHALLALFPVAIWTAVMLGRRGLLSLGTVCVFALLPSAWVLGLFHRTSNIRFEQFACSGEGMAALECLLKNFGLLLPLIVWLLVAACRNLVALVKSRAGLEWSALASAYFPALFVLSMFVAVSPWSWDNTKLMLWSVVGAAPFLWTEVLSRFPKWFRHFAVVVLLLPGLGSLYNALNASRHGYEIARAEEVREAMAARATVPPGSVLAAAPDYNHPWFLAGHAFFLGYEGWLWSHGLDSSKKRRLLSDVLAGSSGWEQKARENGITHVVQSERERKMTGLREDNPFTPWVEVFSGKRVRVFADPKSSAFVSPISSDGRQ